ncbi:MAG: Ig-like domain-containing protein [Flavitalea sp.]
MVLINAPAIAGTIENFNSKKGVSISHIKSVLQAGCWSFHHFDVNSNGWNPEMEGDGAMVATADAAMFPNSGIYTPVLDVSNEIKISFQYTFNENFPADNNRWLNICLANDRNEILQVLEHVDFTGTNATKKNSYSTEFKNVGVGEYRLVLQYGGKGGNSRIAVDKLNISAPFKYPNGCNTAPIAVRDRITGMVDRSATGSLLKNDKDADHEKLTAYLIKGSQNGKVELNEDGTFAFTPEKGFTGSSTSFVYKICDAGAVNLCSENTTVTIYFPNPANSLRLSDFKGSYKNNGQVELAWKTRGESSASEKFVVERSFDGQNWQNSGIVPAVQITNSNDYAYIDKLARNTVQKNDVYYRLKQMFGNGTVATSRLLIVRVYNNKLLTMISVTPNPAKNDISVNVQLQEEGRVSMRLLNSLGNTIIFKSEEAPKGLNTFMMDGSSQIAPGSYSLEVIVNSKERMVVKLIKE